MVKQVKLEKDQVQTREEREPLKDADTSVLFVHNLFSAILLKNEKSEGW